MSEMIERVARAMEFCMIERAGMKGTSRDLSRALARAAIEEMRDPTMAMELAAQASDQRPSTIWGTMINEALK